MFLVCVPLFALCEEDVVHKLRAGTFVKVLSREEINTLTADIGDNVSFINLYDMYVYETNIIPANTIFYGKIEDVREPVTGRDGALKIIIDKMITPDKKEYKIKAHIYSNNENYIGGKQTASAYYHKMYYHGQKFRPMLQVVPLNVYDIGRHTALTAGEEYFIILEDDIISLE